MNTNQLQTPHRPASRRGSALLIVIGTLALIAVFAAIYITIGQGDRRAAATVRMRGEAQNLQDTYAGYIAGVIGRDRLDVFTQHENDGTTVFWNREVTDAPFTDWTVRSESNNPEELFNASGRHTEEGQSASLDFRVPYDPWLASTRPTYLGDPARVNTFSSGFGTPEMKKFLDNRDWSQITNSAPDGRFVNLYNLRPQQFAGGRGGFNAEPGVGITSFPSGERVRRMSEGLSLLKPLNLGDPDSPIQAQTDGYWLPGFDVPQGVLDPNVPAHWTMYQRYMFFPMDQPFWVYDQGGALADWSSIDYPAYQYADTDGDGMADARWFELISAQENQGTSNTPRDDIKRLYDSREFRVFAAARVIDLSSLVNVNTATDGLVAPASDEPFGITPAEVDFRRLLTMQDTARANTARNGTIPISFADLHLPTRYRGSAGDQFQLSESNYAQYMQEYLSPSSTELNPDSPAILIGRYSYDALRIGIDRESGLTGEYFGQNTATATPLAQWYMEDLLQYPRDPLFTEYAGLPGVTPRKPDMISAKIRKDQFEKIGRIDPTNPGFGGYEEFGAGLYGMDDLAELLTFHGINDPDVTSRLESVVSGRLVDDGLSQDRLSPLLSNRPLELDRFRHGSIGTSPNPNRPRVVDGRISEESMVLFALSPRKLMTTISGGVGFRPSTMVWLNGSTPRALTGEESQMSIGAATNDAQSLFGIYSKALAGEIRSPMPDLSSFDDLWTRNLADRRTNTLAGLYATLFYGHRGPEFAYRVAAHAAVNMKDMNDSDDAPTVATVLISNTDDPAGSMRRRLNDLRDSINDDSINIMTDQDVWFFPGEAGGLRFEVPEAYVRTDFDTAANTDTQHRRAFNVYGIEPMPVITEVASMYVYTDAPEGAGGDDDYMTLPGTGMIPLTTSESVTIEGGINPTNPDFILQLLAVQLTNPFDEPIALGGVGAGGLMKKKDLGTLPGTPNPNNFEFLYYLEYNGRFFKLGEFLEWNPDLANGGVDYSVDGGPAPDTYFDPSVHEEFLYRDVALQPGESRVFYVLAQERFDDGPINIDWTGNGVDSRWRDSMVEYNDATDLTEGLPPNHRGSFRTALGSDQKYWTGPAEEWVQNMLLNQGGGTAVHMHQFNPTDGSLSEVGMFSDLFAPRTIPLAGVTRPVAETALQVRLWRKHVVDGEEFSEQTLPTSPPTTRQNLIENDILVDRFFLSDTLENALRTGTDEIDDTVSLEEDLDGVNASTNRNDNKGLSLVRWKTERRLDSRNTSLAGLGAGADVRPFGQIGPWMVQSRRSPSNTRVEYKDTDEIASLASPDVNTFFISNGGTINRTTTEVSDKGDLEVQPTLRDLYDLRRGVYASKVIQTIAVHPGMKSLVGNDAPEDAAGTGNDSAAKFDEEYLAPNNAGQDLYSGIGPKPEIFNKHTWSAERVADLLLTVGIGITYAPDPTRVADQSVVDAEWITFPEAMAIALGYETPVAADTASADSIWYDAVLPAATGAGGQIEYALDDLHLSIDNYVAYIDGDLDQQYTPSSFDVRRGTGVPLALGLIDSVRGNGWLTQVGDSSLTAEQQALLPLTRPTFGKININTAPVEVLRLLPGLSPSLEQYRDGANLVDEWWPKQSRFSGTNLPDLATPVETPDIAAGIVAYRDRLQANPRLDSQGTGTQNLDYASEDFFDPTIGLGRNMIDETTVIPPRDRGGLAGINGLRGTPGFGSLGEVLAMTLDTDPLNTSVAAMLPEVRHLMAGYYGIDAKAMGATTIDTDADGSPDDSVSLDLQVYGTKTNPREGQVEDDYAERLAVANGILNTISVRSDYFAVWFVVQGFRESDVANLGEFDPLVPSFKKRYLMVVDRSNVIKEGQEPKILLLKEVPL